MAISLSIIIPVHNQSGFTRKCLDSLHRFPPGVPFEVIVVDDGSTDDTQELIRQFSGVFPAIRSIVNAAPDGFAKACNRGAREAAGTCLMFLNNDTEVLNGWFNPLWLQLQNRSDVGIVAPKLLFPDGTIQHCGKVWLEAPEGGLKPEHLHYKEEDIFKGFEGSIEFQTVTGACMLLRKEDFFRYGPFDEAYFNGWEDDDLCMAFRTRGLSSIVCMSSTMIHYQGGTLKADAAPIERYLAMLRAKGNRIDADDPVIAGLVELASQRAEAFNVSYTFARERFFRKWGQYVSIDDPLKISGRQGKRVSIVIPVFNRIDLTTACLDAIRRNTGVSGVEIVVVDNGSGDGTSSAIVGMKDVRLISLPRNCGFAAACNTGASYATGDVIVFLNNDTEVAFGWLEPLLNVLQFDTIGAAGSRMLFPDGTIQHAGVVFMDDPISGDSISPCHIGYARPDGPSFNIPGVFSAVTAACMAVPRWLFMLSGGFWQDYWNGFEDADFCCRLRQLGYRAWYCPDSLVVHYESQSGEERTRRQRENMQLLQKRWGGSVQTDYVRISPDKVVTDHRATVIIITYNSEKTIEACLSSVMEFLGIGDQVVVVDNASRDRTCSLLASWEESRQLTVIANKTNLGYSRAVNQALQISRTNYVVLLNPDTVVTKAWTERLVAHFSSLDIAAVGPVSNFAAARQSVDRYWNGSLPEHIAPADAAEAIYSWNKGMAKETPLLIGYCLALRRELLVRFGGLDERLFLGNDDLELSWRLRCHGFRLLVATDVFVFHEGQHSFRSEPSSVVGRLVKESSNALFRILQEHYGISRVPLPETLWDIDWFAPELGAFNASAGFHELLSQPVAFTLPPSPPLVSIIILTFNQLDYTRQCLQSINQHTVHPHEIILVDNASTDGTAQWLEELAETDPCCRLILNRENRGFAAGCNQGLAAARGEFFLLLNNDVVVTPQWLDGLLECHASVPSAGIVGPVTNSASGIQVISVPYADMSEVNCFADRFRAENRHRRIASRRVVGFCMLFSRTLYDDIGALDESFGTGNYEDDDYCLRAAIAGYQNLVAGDVFIHHYGGISFADGNVDYQQTMAGNRALFREKWSRSVDDRERSSRIVLCRVREDADALVMAGRSDEALVLVAAALKQEESDELLELLCRTLMRLKRYRDALVLLEGKFAGRRMMSYQVMIAECLLMLGQTDEAEAALAVLVNELPVSSRGLTLLARCLLSKCRNREAEIVLKHAIKADAGDGCPYYLLSGIMRSRGDAAYANALLKKAFLLAPAVDEHSAGLASFFESNAETERLVQEACTLYPQSSELLRLLVRMAATDGKRVAAAEEYILGFGCHAEVLDIGLQARVRLGDHSNDPASGISVSLCMIVRNEAGNIARCLASCRPLVAEMIVVDTGSSDETARIAQVFGARVIEHKWREDFSEARNKAIEAANCRWILVMDADEALSLRDYELFRSILATADVPCAFSMTTRNYTSQASRKGFVALDGTYPEHEAGLGWTPSDKVRLFPNLPEIRFTGIVHEMVEGAVAAAGLAVKMHPVPVHHYGTLTVDDHTKKRRYYEMGRNKLAQNQHDPKAIYELAVQAGELELLDEAEELWRDLIERNPGFEPAWFNLGYVLLRSGRFQEALAATERALMLEPQNPASMTNRLLCMFFIMPPDSMLESLAAAMGQYPSEKSINLLFHLAGCLCGNLDNGLKDLRKMVSEGVAVRQFVQQVEKYMTFTERRCDAGKIREVLTALGEGLMG